MYEVDVSTVAIKIIIYIISTLRNFSIAQHSFIL